MDESANGLPSCLPNCQNFTSAGCQQLQPTINVVENRIIDIIPKVLLSCGRLPNLWRAALSFCRVAERLVSLFQDLLVTVILNSVCSVRSKCR